MNNGCPTTGWQRTLRMRELALSLRTRVLQEVEHINGRIMMATFTAHGGDVRLACAYAPRSAYPTEDKEYFYDKLAEHVQQFKGRQFIGGDFHARIHHVRECEKDVCGPKKF